ncbi:carbamate kinase [Citroniella saccharovorans]|uniref:Carbamate kinase n=1 Tax=Citroniella saccharovorans TaxID=2053367 RepID=A0AAW9MTD6_9FIRM|nr:carbamate kinase [Citroniella saccharovorans]MEB3429123.1 carbamate kinase [Citroniella saccharovorans]
MSKKYVIALGGNALGNSPKEQEKNLVVTSKAIVDLVEEGVEVTICHGNGPQVGMIKKAMDETFNENGEIFMPFAECGAMSQGYIGFQMQNAIKNELLKRNIRKNVVSVITEVEVDRNDPAFKDPTKPIGSFMTEEEAKKLEEAGIFVMEDAGRGYRQVVPSPKPKRILEKESIENLIENGNIVISCGGGGIPVILENGEYKGVDAVIDKDLSSSLLAREINADVLVILTAIDNVKINFGKENEESLGEISTEEIKKYLKNDEFKKGSMLPKVEAAIEFADSKEGRLTIITSLEKANEIVSAKAGTRISKM